MTTVYFFAATIFKEVFEKEGDAAKELDEKAQKYGYITIVSLESLENATVLAALTFIDISGALIGAIISIAAYIILAVNSKRFLARIPLRKLRLISAILLTISATPLIISSTCLSTPQWLHLVFHHLDEAKALFVSLLASVLVVLICYIIVIDHDSTDSSTDSSSFLITSYS